MLRWLFELFERKERPSHPMPRGGRHSAVHVGVDDAGVRVHRADGRAENLAWADLGSVSIVTNDDGPFANDLFWILQSRDHSISVVVPMGAAGEKELLGAMQERLPGFDNMAVVDAMGSTGNASFVVWDADRRPD